MRTRFARESVTTVLGWKYDRINFDESKDYVVTWSNNFNDPDSLMGKATDLRREDDGWLTAEFVWKDGQPVEDVELALNKNIFMTIYVNHVKTESDHKNSGGVVESCDLISIFACVEEDPWKEKTDG